MLTDSPEKAIAFAKKYKISRVTEIKCPRETCRKTLFAFAGNEQERDAWLEKFKADRFKRHVYCKHCLYGSMGDAEGQFDIKNYTVQ